ncbi:MAG: hypothetical protein AABY32_06690 [Nanoarchaeota archaeon]
MDDEEMDNINPALSFTPDRRRLEHKLVKEMRKAVNKLDVPEEEKKIVNNMWLDYLIEYEHLYTQYQREKTIAIYRALSMSN